MCVFRGSFMNKASTDESVGEKLRGIPVVADAAAVSFDLVDFTPDVSAVVQGWADTSFEFESLTILQGRRFRGDEPAVMLGEILASSIGKKAGDWVEVQGASLRVVGVFRAQDTFSTSSALLPLHQLQQLSGLGGKVAGFDLRLRPPSPGESPEDHLRRAQLTIESQLPGLKAMPAAAVARDNHIVNFIRSTAWATSVIALLIAVLGVANTMAMSVFERTREIGILRALGWRRSRIVRLILLEASILGFAGGLLGIAAGHLGLWALASIRATAGLPRVYPSLVHFGEAMGIALAISLAADSCRPIAGLCSHPPPRCVMSEHLLETRGSGQVLRRRAHPGVAGGRSRSGSRRVRGHPRPQRQRKVDPAASSGRVGDSQSRRGFSPGPKPVRTCGPRRLPFPVGGLGLSSLSSAADPDLPCRTSRSPCGKETAIGAGAGKSRDAAARGRAGGAVPSVSQ